jgi:hypothetical protein
MLHSLIKVKHAVVIHIGAANNLLSKHLNLKAKLIGQVLSLSFASRNPVLSYDN